MSGVFRRQHLPTFQRSRRRRLVHSTLTPDITTGVEFDGSNDYLTRGGDLTGNANGKAGYLAFLVKPSSVASTQRVFTNSSGRFAVSILSGGDFYVAGNNSSGTLILQLRSATALSAGSWYWILASWDLATGAGSLYVNDADDEDGVATILTNDTIEYVPASSPDWAVGANTNGTAKFSGCQAEPVFGQEYIDFSVEANRRDFFGADGTPANKGNDGSTPTGNQPILYLSGGADQFAHNFGSGGAFSITGALVDCLIELFETVTATLSIGAAIQAQRTLAASLSAAIQQQRTATASVDAAVAQALSALTSASAAISATNTATFSLDAALQAAKAATADVDAVIQAVQTAAVSLQGAVQTERASSVQVGAAVQALITAQASLDAVVQATITATTGLSASISEPGVNLVTTALSGAIRALQSASIGLTGAIQGAGSAHAALSAGIAAVQSVTATIDAVIAQIVTATPSVDGAILATMSATASLNARIIALGSFSPSLDRMHTAGQASRIHTQGGQSRTQTVPARTRRH